MAKRICSIDGCGRPHRRNGMCELHSCRVRFGVPLDAPVRIVGDDARRLASYSAPGTIPPGIPWLGECVEWTGARDRWGYGKIQVRRCYTVAHRWAYELQVGPIPDGLALDHLCNNTGCVNVWHLQPVPMSENSRRARLREPAGQRRHW